MPFQIYRLDGVDFVLSDEDIGTPQNYYGFLSSSGAWLILEVCGTTHRFTKGTGEYLTFWEMHRKLKYVHYDKLKFRG